MNILVHIGMIFGVIEEMLHWTTSLNLSAAGSELCEWVQDGIDVHTSHCKYQVKDHSSLWFSAYCAAAINHKNHFV